MNQTDPLDDRIEQILNQFREDDKTNAGYSRTKAKVAINAEIAKAVREGIRDHIAPHLLYCQSHNGMSCCKNCGLAQLQEEPSDE